MTWTNKPPQKAGRYWWRHTDKWKQPAYGILLFAWNEPALARIGIEPELRVRSLCSFQMSHGGELNYYSWASGGGQAFPDLARQYPGIEIWDVPETGPEGFLPELPGKPDWTPPDPVAVAKEREENARKRAAEEKAERQTFEKRVADARAAGEVLYRCDGCDQVYDRDALVQVRECPHCDQKFDGTENGQACPQCNRRFSRNVSDLGCPDCLGEEDCEALPETPEPARPTKKSKKL